MKTETIQLRFGGFYESIHDDAINSLAEALYGDASAEEEPELEGLFDKINWQKTGENYAKAYLIKLEQYIKDNFNSADEIALEFVKINSPREYNFTTDTIEIAINEVAHDFFIKAANLFLNEAFTKDFAELVRNYTTARDGFSPFYTYADAFNNKDNILIEFILEYLADRFNETGELPHEFEIAFDE